MAHRVILYLTDDTYNALRRTPLKRMSLSGRIETMIMHSIDEVFMMPEEDELKVENKLREEIKHEQ